MDSTLVETKVAVDIAVLQTNYTHLDEKITSFHDETRAGMKQINDKFDLVLAEMSEQKSRSKSRAAMWAMVRHGATIGVTLLLAKLFREPVSLP